MQGEGEGEDNGKQKSYEEQKKKLDIMEQQEKVDREQLEQSERDLDKVRQSLNTLKASGPLMNSRLDRLKQEQEQAMAEKERLAN